MTDHSELVARLRDCPWVITDEAADAVEAQARENAELRAKVARLADAIKAEQAAKAVYEDAPADGGFMTPQKNRALSAWLKTRADLYAALREIGGQHD